MKYCKRCSYCLAGTGAAACPECGLAYDAQDKSSYVSWPGYRESQTAGQHVLIMGIGYCLLPFIFAIWTDGLALDLLCMAYVILGPMIERGSRPAGKWAIGLLTLYALIGLLSIMLGDWADLSGWIAKRREFPLLWSAIHVVWSSINIVLVWRFLSVSRTDAPPK